MLSITIPPEVVRVLDAIRMAGGKPLLVGGCVRDALMGIQNSKDYDVEVFGLPLPKLREVLERAGKVDAVGVSFGVFKIAGLPAEFSVPRRDNKIGAGHRGFEVSCDHKMTFAEAAKRRDLTINAIGYCPFTGKVFDEYWGRQDIDRLRLECVDLDTFLDDPLRALRVVQFQSRFGFGLGPALRDLLHKASLAELPGERLYPEFLKMLRGPYVYSFAWPTLWNFGIADQFPELAALRLCEQDKEHHPEGNVAVHTGMAIGEAVTLTQDPVVLFAVLCHDFGKPATTKMEDGRWRAKGHEDAGEEPTRSFLNRLRASHDLTSAVVALVKRHLSPVLMPHSKASPGAYRRLARFLQGSGATMLQLYQVSRADRFGRGTVEASRREFPEGVEFLERTRNLSLEEKACEDAVMGRHLVERGLQPGPQFKPILDLCREYQYESGETDPAKIMDALGVKK